MENATKALLIAASVLIVIVLIAVGVLLLGNVSDTSSEAQNVGDSIGVATDSAVSDALGGIKGTIISKKKFNSFINDLGNKYSTSSQLFDTIFNTQNSKLNNQIQVIGYVYQDDYRNLNNDVPDNTLKELLKDFDSKNQENNKEIFKYEIGTWIPYLERNGKLETMDNPTDFDEMKDRLKSLYEKQKGISLTDAQYDVKRKVCKWIFGYDEWGYIDRAIYISGMYF